MLEKIRSLVYDLIVENREANTLFLCRKDWDLFQEELNSHKADVSIANADLGHKFTKITIDGVTLIVEWVHGDYSFISESKIIG